MKSGYLLCFVLIASCAVFQPGKKMAAKKKAAAAKANTAGSAAATAESDSMRTVVSLALNAPKPYASVITKNFITQKGLFIVHQAKDSFYFEIPDSLLGRDIMVINRLKRGPGGFGVYAGEELDEKTILFEKGHNETIQIRYDLIINDADSTDAIYKAVVKSSVNPVVYSFPIKAYGKDSASYVIDATKFLKENSFVNTLEQSSIGKSVDDKQLKDHFVESIHVYPINVEITISKNGTSRGVATTGIPAGPVTLESHTSFIALPRVPLQRRFFDPRVGYFADYYYGYGDKQQKTEINRFVLRWRLEPRSEDKAKWESGELVEPAKPIVFYIDPATPKQWRPYLIAGINDWQKAFEQAGFKNAIIGKEWPENDSTMQMEDARWSFINYFPSEVQNAYGPQVHDPRSGEIIQSHIGWYHNVMKLLHNWYMVQAAAVDPQARVPKFDDALMGQLIRFVSSHEVGHTLGLRHNFGSSSRTPVDSLRNKAWVQKHGHTASIMDYARFNYVAQPEDKFTQDELFPRIGEYDKWAIQWAYKNSGATNAVDDRKVITKWLVDSLLANPRLWFGDGETKKTDPRCQTEDLGDNAARASVYGIKNLKRILPNLPEWTRQTGGIYLDLADMYKGVKDQYMRYVQHVLNYVGGSYTTVIAEDVKADVFAPVSKAMQIEALTFFNDEVFDKPYWLLDKRVLNKVGEPAQPDFVEDLQVRLINSLLDLKVMNKLIANSRQFGEQKTLQLDEYLTVIHNGVWKELKQGKAIDGYRRSLQKSYFGSMQEIYLSNIPEMSETDIYSTVRMELYKLQKEIKAAIPATADNQSRYHLEDLAERIKKVMSQKAN